MNNMDDFCYERKPTHATTKLTWLAVSMNKSIKKVMCVLQYAPWAEATSKSELKIKPIALAIVELRWFEGIS